MIVAASPTAATDDNAPELVDLSVVIPAYNEAAIIEETMRVTVEELNRLGCSYELVVVDDGSHDDTYRLAGQVATEQVAAHQGAVRVVTYTKNGGKGYAVKFGAAQTKGSFVAFLDADLELHPRLLARMIEIQRTTGADIVIGSKRHPESVIDYPTERKLYSTIYYYVCRLLFGLPVRDTQTGIKLIRGDFAREILPRLEVNRFAYDLEMLAVAHQLGLHIAEAPVELNFSRNFRRIGPNDIWRICADTARIWLRLRQSPSVAPESKANRNGNTRI